MNRNKNDDERNEIQEITETLEQLQITIDRLNQRRDTLIQRNTKNKTTKTRTNNSKQDFKVGDLVEVKDNYKGRKGIRGRISSIHGTQVRLEPTDGRPGFRKYKENIQLIEE